MIIILSNSIRYASSVVTVETGTAGGWIRIVFRDDGPGFKAGEESRVFDRFYKDPHHDGTGIGLSITRAIIEKHRGTGSGLQRQTP